MEFKDTSTDLHLVDSVEESTLIVKEVSYDDEKLISFEIDMNGNPVHANIEQTKNLIEKLTRWVQQNS